MNTVERVKKICKERKFAISKLEKECGFANGYIGQLRKGSFPDDRLGKISEVLGLSVDYLITGEDNNYTPDNALLDARISEDTELKEAIKKYYSLDKQTQKHILEGIDLFWRAKNTDTK